MLRLRHCTVDPVPCPLMQPAWSACRSIEVVVRDVQLTAEIGDGAAHFVQLFRREAHQGTHRWREFGCREPFVKGAGVLTLFVDMRQAMVFEECREAVPAIRMGLVEPVPVLIRRRG
jgi:hypothetical protein